MLQPLRKLWNTDRGLALVMASLFMLLLALYAGEAMIVPTAGAQTAVPSAAAVQIAASPGATAALATAASTAATFTTAPQRVLGRTYDLVVTFSGISGSYSTCTLQPEVSADDTNFANQGSPVSVTPANGTAVVQSTVNVIGAWHQFVFACGGYGSAGTATVYEVFHP